MSKVKKLLAILLAVVMVMSLTMTMSVFAEGEGGGASGGESGESQTPTPGTLIIEGSQIGEHYYLYKVLDVTWNRETQAYSYKVTDEFKDYFQNLLNDHTSTGSTFDSKVHAHIKGLTTTEAIRAFAVNLADHISTVNKDDNTGNNIICTADIKATNDNTTVDTTVTPNEYTTTATGIGYGYYLMIPTTGTEPNESGSVMFSLQTMTDTCTIENKVSFPTPVKKVKGPELNSAYGDTAFAGVGETVSFQVTGKIQTIEGYDTYRFEIHDTLSHMTYTDKTMELFINNRKVAYYNADGKLCISVPNPNAGEEAQTPYNVIVIDDLPSDSPYKNLLTMSYNNSTKELDVIISDLKPFFKQDTVLEGKLTYDAVVDANAVIGNSGNENSVYFTYSNDPLTGSTANSIIDKTKTFVIELTINKVDASNKPLTGSEWALYEVGEDTEENPSGLTPVKINTSDGKTADPKFVFQGIGIGTYRLVETKAPDGYTKIDHPITFTVTATGDLKSGAITELGCTIKSHSNVVSDSKVVNVANGTIEFTVKNNQMGRLPSTGGAGLYIVAGVAIVALLGFGGTAMLKRKVNGGE